MNLSADWRSALYPEDWSPGFTDEAGRFLHDFSYAGYRRGEADLPRLDGPAIDVTQAPYLADSSGETDATAAIQAALNEAAQRGGGIVFMPAGRYRIAPPEGAAAALKVQGSHIVLRGAGPDKTLLLNSEIRMREKKVLLVQSAKPLWWFADGAHLRVAAATADFPNRATVLPVANPALFAVGDLVAVRNSLTERFAAELGMAGKWTRATMKDRALIFFRRIVAVNAADGTLEIDVPIRYELKKEDNARVVKMSGGLISDVGLEDFSIGMKEHPGQGFNEEDYNVSGTAGYDAHQSHAVVFSEAENCWMRRVNSCLYPGNSSETHVLSNGVKLARSRFITVEDCDWRNTQYKGGGGNGYLFTLQSNESLLRNCYAENGRHNYDFGTMNCSGNVILDCTTKHGKLPSDFHMHFSVANLIDNMTCDGDFLEAKYRPYGGAAVHGVTTSQSVFWNTNGLSYFSARFGNDARRRNRPRFLIQSEQFGDGYVIGTRGPAYEVKTSDFCEGVGKGDSLAPRSLYADQLKRRLKK